MSVRERLSLKDQWDLQQFEEKIPSLTKSDLERFIAATEKQIEVRRWWMRDGERDALNLVLASLKKALTEKVEATEKEAAMKAVAELEAAEIEAAVKAVAEMEAAEKAKAEEELASLFEPTVTWAYKEPSPYEKDMSQIVGAETATIADTIALRVEDCLHIGGGL